MNKLDVICLIKRCVEESWSEMDDSYDNAVEHEIQLQLFDAAKRYLQHLIDTEEYHNPINWYTEIWDDKDIEKALMHNHHYASEEKIKMVKEKCSDLFDKAEREERLNRLVKEIFLLTQEKRDKKVMDTLIEINCVDSSFPQKVCEVLCKTPIRAYRDINNSEVYYASLYDSQIPKRVGNRSEFVCWIGSFLDDGEVISGTDYIEMILDGCGVLLGIDKFGNYYVEEMDL